MKLKKYIYTKTQQNSSVERNKLTAKVNFDKLFKTQIWIRKKRNEKDVGQRPSPLLKKNKDYFKKKNRAKQTLLFIIIILKKKNRAKQTQT